MLSQTQLSEEEKYWANILLNAIQKTNQKSQGEASLCNICLCIDDSQSIGINNFLQIRNFLEKFVKLFHFEKDIKTSPSLLSILKFGNQVKKIISQSSSQEQIEASIENMEYLKGNTNTYEVLEMAILELELAKKIPGRENSLGVIFLFTDDNIQGSYRQEQIGQIYKQIAQNSSQLTLYLLMMGGATVTLQQMRDYNITPGQQIPPPTIVHYGSNDQSQFFFEIQPQPSNIKEDELIDLIEYQIFQQNDQLTRGTLKYEYKAMILMGWTVIYGEMLELRFRAKLRNGCWSQWNNEYEKKPFQFLLKDSSIKHLIEIIQQGESAIVKKVEEMKDKLCKYKLSEKYRSIGINKLNIVFLGLGGAGKSSTINTFRSFKLQRFSEVQAYGPQAIDITATITQVPIFQEDSDINILDTAGIQFAFDEDSLDEKISVESSNYVSGILEYLMKGNLRSGFQILDSSTREWTAKDFKKEKAIKLQTFNETPQINDMPHAYCLIVNMLTSNQKRTIDAIKEFTQKIKETQQCSPTIILTQADSYLKGFWKVRHGVTITEVSMEQIIREEKSNLMGAIQRFCELIGQIISYKNIFYFSNFTGHFYQRDFIRELLGLFILENQVYNAIDFLDREVEKTIAITLRIFEEKEFFNIGKIVRNNILNLQLSQDFRDEVEKIVQEHPKVRSLRSFLGQPFVFKYLSFQNQEEDVIEEINYSIYKLSDIVRQNEKGIKELVISMYDQYENQLGDQKVQTIIQQLKSKQSITNQSKSSASLQLINDYEIQQSPQKISQQQELLIKNQQQQQIQQLLTILVKVKEQDGSQFTVKYQNIPNEFTLAQLRDKIAQEEFKEDSTDVQTYLFHFMDSKIKPEREKKEFLSNYATNFQQGLIQIDFVQLQSSQKQSSPLQQKVAKQQGNQPLSIQQQQKLSISVELDLGSESIKTSLEIESSDTFKNVITIMQEEFDELSTSGSIQLTFNGKEVVDWGTQVKMMGLGTISNNLHIKLQTQIQLVVVLNDENATNIKLSLNQTLSNLKKILEEEYGEDYSDYVFTVNDKEQLDEDVKLVDLGLKENQKIGLFKPALLSILYGEHEYTVPKIKGNMTLSEARKILAQHSEIMMKDKADKFVHTQTSPPSQILQRDEDKHLVSQIAYKNVLTIKKK